MNKKIFDLDEGSIAGFFLGSLENSCPNTVILNNPAEGYAINTYEGKISSLFVCFLEGYNGFQCFSGLIKLNNCYFTVNSKTTIDEIKNIVDSDLIMPPKTTYIEPKLRSALTIYEI